jgi:two-component system sensor histidine kinase SenX3
MIDSQSRRLADLLDELAELRSLDNPRHIDIEPIQLGKLCQQMVEEFAPMAHAGGIDLTCTPTEMVVQTDIRLVKTVLRNLVTNALRFTSAGESIIISNWLERSGVVVSVRDTGAGIAPEHQERIFDRFYRTEAARDRITGGTGLGLSIARGAATALAGHIQVKSELGTGSDFRLTLPRTDTALRTDGESHQRSSSVHP